MFLALVLISVAGYALQTTLMAPYYRRDPLAGTAHRGLSLGITMAPLLFLAGAPSLLKFAGSFHLIFAASVLAFVCNIFTAVSLRHLPIGVSTGCQMGAIVITSTLLGVLGYGEVLRPMHVAGIGLILAGNSAVCFAAQGSKVILDRKALVGITYGILGGTSIACSYLFLTRLSREVDPYATAYFWELIIGVIALVLVLLRKKDPNSPNRLVWREFPKVLWRSSPTLLGTGGLALALTKGPLSIAAAVSSTVVIVVTVLSFILYRERPTRVQVAAIAVVFAAVLLLRLAAA